MSMDSRTTSTNAALGSPADAEPWFARLLESDCPSDERAAFERWYAASPTHAAAYHEIEYLWKQSGDAVRDPLVVAAANRALHWTKPEPRFRRGWFFPVAASAVAAVLALIFIPRWFTAPVDPPGTHYITAVGQQRTVSLADGSSIVLDTNTEVVERYGAHKRRVDLLHGQARFQVQGNPQRPFVVHVQDGTVTAVGTRFQVRINGDTAAVTLFQGKLSIAAVPKDGASQAVLLAAGQQVVFDRTGRIAPIQPADIATADAWAAGNLIVHDWRLPDLLAEMNRYSPTQLQIGDASLESIHISGVFRTGDQQELIQILQQGWPIQANRISPARVVLSHNR
ncbi:MAG TPA: FecR family protein [Rhodanobacter sp.]|nr:FecR family protein [Rhodanobacter sp.]